MFIIGFIVGLIVGGIGGLFISALLRGSKSKEY